MRELCFLCPKARVLLALLLCVVLFTGCAGVRPDAGAGAFGPSWQAREAAYLQEEEEGEDDFGDRMGKADRRSTRKSRGRDAAWMIGIVVVLAALYSLGEDEDSEEELMFGDTFKVAEPANRAFGFEMPVGN